MIKILFFIEKFGGGGAEKVLRDLVNHMDLSRFDITVQSVWPYEEQKLLKPGIRYRSVYPVRNKWTERIYRLEAALGWTYFFHIKDNYDIEVAYLESSPTKIMASSTNKKAKKIAWVHCDLAYNCSDIPAFVQKTKKWYDRFDRIVCVSKDVKASFDELFEHRYQTLVLYNTINDAEIRDKSEEKAEQLPMKRRITMVSVGRLWKQKGYDRLLRILHRLLQEGYALDLWILGEGPERSSLEEFIAENGLSDNVRFFGFQSNPYPFVKAADLLVCSSRYEGLSTFATEGVILGRPIVTTNCTGMQELLGDSEYGYITENSEPALYEGIKKMLDSEELRAYYSQKAVEKGKTLCARALTEQTEHFFDELIGEKA